MPDHASRRTPSIAPPIIYGVLLVLVTLTLTVFWNVAWVTDWLRAQPLSGPLWWTILVGGYVLFGAVIAGVILFVVSLARQIRLNQRQQNFIDAVTHELKSPLTSLKLHLETIRMRQLPPEKLAEFTDLMLADVERLNALIDHVLEAAQIDGRTPDRQFQDVDVTAAVREAIANTRHRHGLPEEAVTLAVADQVTVSTDPVAFQLVMGNLLENAVKYSRDVVRVRVAVRARLAGGVEVAVADDGVGIPRNQVKRIFQRFHRVGNEMTRIRQGTGLGLYIVKETLEQMQGTIRAESPGEGLGSVFTLTLPKDAHA